MSYEIVKKENSEITIKATVGKDEFEKAVQAAYNKNKGKPLIIDKFSHCLKIEN